jgi:hypothetical protein
MYYNLICNFYINSYVDKNFHSCKKWVLHEVRQKVSPLMVILIAGHICFVLISPLGELRGMVCFMIVMVR